ncbi:MAG: tetratricopeptide repeat protein [Pirellulales bacterium]|nr:tetratricopeptide repeat protein [Pirellulales bacterium]
MRTCSIAVLALSALSLTGCANFELPKPPSLLSPSRNKLTGRGSFNDELSKARNAEMAGQFEEARKGYQELIVSHPKRYEPYHRLAVVADRQQRHREAQGLYTEAIARKPNEPELFNDLGYCFYLQGKLDKAESALTKAVSLAPSVSRFRNNLGLVYGHMGRYEEALESFRRSGSEADAQFNLAFIYASQEKNDEAKACFQQALASDPGHEKSQRALQGFQRFERDPDGVYENNEMVKDGMRWIPFVEGSAPVQQASATAPAAGANPPGAVVTGGSTSATTSALRVANDADTSVMQQRAASLLQQRLSAEQLQ